MTNKENTPFTGKTKAGIKTFEFIWLMAIIGSVVALSTDIMLAVLPEIGQHLNVAQANDQQAIIIIFLMAFGISQVFFGPLSDRFGRRPVLLIGLIFFSVTSVAASFTTDYDTMLFLRILQGIGAAAVRITGIAIVRDCFVGRDMARIMSYVFTTFLLIPIIAPGLGQIITITFNWQAIFIALCVFSTVIWVWAYFRFSETLDRENQRKISFPMLWQAFKEIVSNRMTFAYTAAMTCTFSGLFSFLILSQPIFDQIYGFGEYFSLIFGLNAVGMGIVAFLNGRIVNRLGMRMIAHSGLIAYISSGFLLYLVSLSGTPPFWVTSVLIFIAMAGFGLMSTNFNSIAMEPMGHIAGSATSIIGVFSFTIGSALGGLVGRTFDGTVAPIALCFTLGGLAALIIILWAERGKLFRR